MKLKFVTVQRGRPQPASQLNVAVLRYDNWDDFTFKTLFHLTLFDQNGTETSIGPVKIGRLGQRPNSHTELPEEFDQLDNHFFSLGQGVDYYKIISSLDFALRQNLLTGLNDLVNNPPLLQRALLEEVTKTSLLRDVSETSVRGQFKRILEGGDVVEDFRFAFEMPSTNDRAGLTLEFSIDPSTSPPSNIHVLIGRNGIGKTYVLNKMVEALVLDPSSEKDDTDCRFIDRTRFWDDNHSGSIFSGVVSIAFSAFDPFPPIPEQKDKTKGIRYAYVGLKQPSKANDINAPPMTPEMLTEAFVSSLATCHKLRKGARWREAIETLSSDPVFNELSSVSLLFFGTDSFDESAARSFFSAASSGHRIVLLTITKLVEEVEERTLVLIDEPESHLHPPLLSAFIRALSDLLAYRNGVAIVATHSPVVLQEAPRNCVWNLRRTGLTAVVERPSIETFGENVGVLTREIFGLEVTQSGFHQLLLEVIEDKHSYALVLDYFRGQLGTEARSLIRALAVQQERDQQEP